MPDNKTDEELLQALVDSSDQDILTGALPRSEVRAELQAAGADLASMAERGRTAIAELLNRRRLAWQETARAKIEHQRAQQTKPTAVGSRSRSDLLSRIERLRSDPSLRGAASIAFHKRKPEQASVEELEQILEEFDLLKKMSDDADAEDE